MNSSKKTRVTVKDVAAKANVSAMTVSLALRKSPRISEATAQRVVKVAHEMGYRPSLSARALRNGQTHMVGCLLPFKNPDFWGKIYDGFSSQLDNHDYHALLATTQERVGKIEKMLDHCAAVFDGVMLIPVADMHANEHFIERLKQLNIPFVVIGPFKDYDVDCVTNDDLAGTSNTITWLIEQGHKNIAWVGGKLYRVGQVRLKGFKDALAKAKLDNSRVYIAKEYWGQEAGYLGTKSLLRKNKDTTVIVADSDAAAQGAYQAISEEHLNIPEEISVIGHSNSTLCTQLQPPLTSIEQSPEELGKAAARLLMERINKEGISENQEILLPTSLIIRQSCAERI